MRGGALGIAEFHRACLEFELAVDDFGKRLGRAREYRMSERVEPCLVRTEFISIHVLDPFADDHDAVTKLVNGLLHLGEERLLVERDFRHQDDVRPVGRFALGQDGAGREPAGGPAHDLDYAAGAVVGGHAGDVLCDLHHGRGVVLGRATVAGRMVGVGQVVVDGLGHADASHREAPLDCLVMQLVVGILRIVAAGVEKITDVVRLEDIEQSVHVPGGLLGVFLELNLVAASTQRRGGGVLEFLDRARFLLVQVDQVLVKDAEDAVEPAVNLLDLFRVSAGLLDDAGHAGVDDRGGAAGLADQQVAHEVVVGRGNRRFRLGVQVVDQRFAGVGRIVCCRVLVFRF